MSQIEGLSNASLLTVTCKSPEPKLIQQACFEIVFDV